MFSNRSAAYLALGKLADALRDAKETVKCAGKWWKGYMRLAKAHQALKEGHAALSACARAWELARMEMEVPFFRVL